MKRKLIILRAFLCVALLCVVAGVLFYLYGYPDKMDGDIQNTTQEGSEGVVEINNNSDNSPIVSDMIVSEMDELYQSVKKCVVGISMQESVGSGIIWDSKDGQLLIIANRHLLEDGAEPKVTFWNGRESVGRIYSLSEEYDFGMVSVDMTGSEDIAVAKHPSNTEELRNTILWTVGEPVLQVGFYQQEQLCFSGEVSGSEYMPLFNTNVLVTRCYTRAGMSGGAVFDRYGSLIGMISGGDVPENSSVREADITFSLPIELLEELAR